MTDRQFHVTIEGLDDDAIVWEGDVIFAEFVIGLEGDAVLAIAGPDPEPMVEQLEAVETEYLKKSMSYKIHSTNFSNVEISPINE